MYKILVKHEATSYLEERIEEYVFDTEEEAERFYANACACDLYAYYE